jgi:hypothetical protein
MAVIPGQTTFGLSDLNRDCTAAIVYELQAGTWIAKGCVTSSGNWHAEEWLINDLQNANTLAIAAGAKIRIEITKSPCHQNVGDHDCAAQLAGLLASGRVTGIQLRYLGLYNTGSHEGAMWAQGGIIALSAGGIDCDPWDWPNDSTPPQKTAMTNLQATISTYTGPGRYTDPSSRGDYARRPESKGFVNYVNQR